jgi:hypothetical protein
VTIGTFKTSKEYKFRIDKDGVLYFIIIMLSLFFF